MLLLGATLMWVAWAAPWDLGLRPCCSRGMCCYPLSRLLPGAMQKSVVCAASWIMRMPLGCAATRELYWWERPALPPEAMGMPGSLLLLRATSGFEVFMQLGSVLMSMIWVTTKGHVVICSLCCHLKPCQGPWFCFEEQGGYFHHNIGWWPQMHSWGETWRASVTTLTLLIPTPTKNNNNNNRT